MALVGHSLSALPRAMHMFAVATFVLLTYPRAGGAESAAFAPNAFKRDLAEPMKRNQSNYEGFVYDFNGAPASDLTPNGMLQPNQVGTNAFLSTLPGDGNGQTLVTLGPCASNTPHTHPRGSEISTVLSGSINFGMIEENALANMLKIQPKLSVGQTIHIPQGIMHFSHNPTCEKASFLANFATRDPGTQTVWASLMAVPTEILHAATGIPEAKINDLKQYKLVIAPGTGGEECLKKCGRSFDLVSGSAGDELSALVPMYMSAQAFANVSLSKIVSLQSNNFTRPANA